MTFMSVEEAVALAHWLASDAENSRKIGSRARERVLQGHTWEHRVKTVLSDVTAILQMKHS